jgi:hypothetical protein
LTLDGGVFFSGGFQCLGVRDRRGDEGKRRDEAFSNGDFDEAIDYYTEAIEEDNGFADAYNA